MIVQRHPSLRRTLRFVGLSLPVLLAYDVVVTLIYVTLRQHWLAVEHMPMGLLGSAIALIVTFRNNAAYARWVEARTLWGAILNNARSLARACLALTADRAVQVRIIRGQIAHAIALRHHLLRLPPWDAVAPYLPEGAAHRLSGATNLPAQLQMELAAAIAAARTAGALSDVCATELDRILTELANAQGGLERIKNTPMPRQYNHLPRLFTIAFCILLPLTLVADLGYVTPIASTVIGIMFLSLDQVGRNLEDPFEATVNDIPMHAITRTIEIDLLQAIGAEAPKPIQPIRGILW